MRKNCTFFGHRDAPLSLYSSILETVTHLHQQHAPVFLVGNEGNFDTLVQKAIAEAGCTHPDLQGYIVLPSYSTSEVFPLPTIVPNDFETYPPRFAVDRRNLWMLKQSSIVVTYVRHSWGGAAKFSQLAGKQHKIIIPL